MTAEFTVLRECAANPDFGTATGTRLVARQKSDACRPSYLPSPPRPNGIFEFADDNMHEFTHARGHSSCTIPGVARIERLMGDRGEYPSVNFRRHLSRFADLATMVCVDDENNGIRDPEQVSFRQFYCRPRRGGLV